MAMLHSVSKGGSYWQWFKIEAREAYESRERPDSDIAE